MVAEHVVDRRADPGRARVRRAACNRRSAAARLGWFRPGHRRRHVEQFRDDLGGEPEHGADPVDEHAVACEEQPTGLVGFVVGRHGHPGRVPARQADERGPDRVAAGVRGQGSVGLSGGHGVGAVRGAWPDRRALRRRAAAPVHRVALALRHGSASAGGAGTTPRI